MRHNFMKIALTSKLLVFLSSFSERSFTVFGPDDRKNDYNSHQKDQHVDPEIEHANKRVQRMFSFLLPELMNLSEVLRSISAT